MNLRFRFLVIEDISLKKKRSRCGGNAMSLAFLFFNFLLNCFTNIKSVKDCISIALIVVSLEFRLLIPPWTKCGNIAIIPFIINKGTFPF